MGMGGLRQRGGQRPAAPTISGPQTDDVRWIQKNALPALTQNPVEFKQVKSGMRRALCGAAPVRQTDSLIHSTGVPFSTFS